MTTNLPSKDPANQTSLPGALGEIFKKQIQGVQGQLPARVVSVNGARVTVQPLIAVLSTNGTAVSRAPIASVPVLTLGAGGFAVTFPVKVGDMGWIEASDRDISLFLQNMREARPSSTRLHSFEDGRFIPDVFAQAARVDADAAALQTLDGSVRVSVSATGIKLVAGNFFFNLDATAGITTNAPFNTSGNQAFNINGISWLGHGHTGIQHGTDVSGGVKV